MTRRGVLTLLLGVAIYVVAWLFGAKALYPVATGLVLAAIAARTWVRLAARPITLRRRIGGGLLGRRASGGHLFEGEDVWVSLEARSEARVPLPSISVTERIAKLGERHTPLQPAPRPLPGHVRDREGVARTLCRRGGDGDDRRPLRTGALGGRSRRRRRIARLPAAGRTRSALFGEWGARARRPEAAAAASVGLRPPLGARVRAGRITAKGALADNGAARPADGEGARGCPS